MACYGVGLSADLEDELRRQPADVRGEFWAMCDRLVGRCLPRTGRREQLGLPGFTSESVRTETYPLGSNGAVIYQCAGEGQVEVVDVRWPTDVDGGTPAGRPGRDRF